MSDIGEGLGDGLRNDHTSWLQHTPVEFPARLSDPENRSFRSIRTLFSDRVMHLWIKDTIRHNSFESCLARRLVPQCLHRFHAHEPLFPGSLRLLWERVCRRHKAHRQTELIEGWEQITEQALVRIFGQFTTFALAFTLQVLVIGLRSLPAGELVLT